MHKARLTEEEKNIRRAKDADRKRCERKAEWARLTDEEKIMRNEKEAERKRCERDAETLEKRNKRLKKSN